VLLPVIERYWGLTNPQFSRGDAAFAGTKVLRLLEKESFRYAPHDGAPLFRGSALQSLTSGGSLV
jgi:hypothetical protein